MLTHFWDDGHQDISERIAEMEMSDTYAGQPEILALVHVIKRPIAVHYMGTNKSTLFGEVYQQIGGKIPLDIMISLFLKLRKTSLQSCPKLVPM